jgi:hypothetical protein
MPLQPIESLSDTDNFLSAQGAVVNIIAISYISLIS